MTIAHAACTDLGLVRSANEDYFRLLPEIGLYILADGMGGARGGGTASRVAVETVAEEMLSVEQPDAAALIAAVERAHECIRSQAALDQSLNGMGTTLIAALLNAEDVAIVSVGDSRAYRYGADGIHLLTEDQTWVREVGIPLGLSEDVLRRHPNRHALTMAVGIEMELESRYYGTNLEPGCGLLLSSDGLHGLVSDEQVFRLVGDRAKSLEDRCAALIRAAHAAGGTDNITAVLIEAS